MTDFSPCGVITLTTDFGLAEPFVGVMKGRILARFATARIIDLSHAIPAHQPGIAGFWLSRCFEDFPTGTVHVAVVDPGVGTDRGILCMAAQGHALLAPDNGLLACCAARCPEAQVVRLADAALAELGIRHVSATFHGRDIFAPVAAELAAGRVQPASLGGTPSAALGAMQRGVLGAVQSVAALAADGPRTAGGEVDGRVVTVDHFGNLITDIEAASIAGMVAPHALIGGRSLPVRRTYDDVQPGTLLALVNSFDLLEIAAGRASAAAALGVGPGARVSVRPAGAT
ncbi:MAG: SAM hydrolase/SAM-dependent halogenase family protein [Steroidobacteraceae bacterium]